MAYTYEKHFRSHREDGRIPSSQAAFMELMRRRPQELSLPEELTRERFLAWQLAIRQKARELLRMPEEMPSSPPRRLSSVQREGYRAEKWEFYPDPVSAVPLLLLVPDSATEATPAPAVFCFPGSNQSKELFAGEPLTEGRAGQASRYPERNAMGRFYAQNGMIAAVFDPVAIGETALDADDPNYGWRSRNYLTHGLLEYGYTHTGLSVYQKLAFWKYAREFPFLDPSRLGVSGHSLGSETAVYMAAVCDDVKAVVFNDFLSNPGARYLNHTEWESDEQMQSMASTFHIVPGEFRYYGFEDLCAALCPRYLALNEGGAEEYTGDVARAYAALGAEDHLLLTQYPVYRDPATRTHSHPVPDRGLSIEQYFAISYVDAPDHSFRAEPSVALLKRAFGL